MNFQKKIYFSKKNLKKKKSEARSLPPPQISKNFFTQLSKIE